MSLKQEIEELRNELAGKADAADLKQAAAEAVAESADKAEAAKDAATETVEDAAEQAAPGTEGDFRTVLNATLSEAGAKAEAFGAKYPMLTAVAALGLGLAVGLSLGRKRS